MPPLRRQFQIAIDLVAQLAGERPEAAVVPAANGGRAGGRTVAIAARCGPFRMQRPAWAGGLIRRPSSRHQGHGLSRRRHGHHMILGRSFEFLLIAEGFHGQINRSARNSALPELLPSSGIKASRASVENPVAGGIRGRLRKRLGREPVYRNAVCIRNRGWPHCLGQVWTTIRFGQSLMISAMGILEFRLGSRNTGQAEGRTPVAFSRFAIVLLAVDRSNKRHLVQTFFPFFRHWRGARKPGRFWWGDWA